MTPIDDIRGDAVDDPGTGDSTMMLRRWYLDAAPSADRRQAAIDRLFSGRSVSMPGLQPRRGWLVSRRWRIGMALAASAAAAMALTWSLRQTPGPPPAGAGGTRLVAFEVRLPSRLVHDVALTGDFNGWDPRATPMHREGSSDVWKIAIALPPGRHVYSFVVDGTEWVIDPLAPSAEFDELGPANVIAVSGAGD
jgi:Glycogen recognition site of AMP-activated protein kinase